MKWVRHHLGHSEIDTRVLAGSPMPSPGDSIINTTGRRLPREASE